MKGPEDPNIEVRLLFAANLRRLVAADPRTPAEIARLVWPHSEPDVARRNLIRLRAEDSDLGSWPESTSMGALVRVLGLPAHELLMPLEGESARSWGAR